MTTIVLADDHHIVRQALRVLLESEDGFSVVGEAGDGLEAVEVTLRLGPDVLVVDMKMPGLNGLEVTREVVRRCASTRVVMLSRYDNEVYVLESLRNGATGYVLKGSTSDDLVQAIRDVADGRRHLSPPLSERAIAAYVEKAKSKPIDAYDTLTSRERAVLCLAAEGCSSAEISTRLSISARTAEAHRLNLMHKLNIHCQDDLVRYATERGILPLD